MSRITRITLAVAIGMLALPAPGAVAQKLSTPTSAPAAETSRLPGMHQTTAVDWLTCSSSDVKLIDERIKACTTVIKSGQESKDRMALAYYRRGTGWDLKREIDQAIADFDQAIKLDPSLADAYNDRGNARLVKGDADGAMADYDAAIRLDSTDEDALNNRGRALFNRGEYEKAIADLDKAIDLDPKFVRAYRNRGMVRFALGRFDAAAHDFRQSLRLQPFDGYSLLWQHIAEARGGRDDTSELNRRGDKLDAAGWPGPIIQVYRGESTAVAVRLAASRPDQKCDAAFYMGELDLLNGRMSSARSLLEHAADICPKDFTEHSAALIELKRTAR